MALALGDRSLSICIPVRHLLAFSKMLRYNGVATDTLYQEAAMNDQMIPLQPEQTYLAIRSSIVGAQRKLSAAVNTAMVTAYWEIWLSL